MTIYVVTSGRYSDYHIDAVFTDRKQAELYCAATDSRRGDYDNDSCNIEEYETDGVKLEGEVYYGISFYANIYNSGFNITSANQIYSISPVVTKNVIDRTCWNRFIEGAISTNKVYDFQQRKKIVEDYLAKMQAEKEGL